MQAKPLSRDQQIEQYEKELANMRVKLEAKESELEAVRSVHDSRTRRRVGSRAKPKQTHYAPRLLQDL